jgi:hypothetical protein
VLGLVLLLVLVVKLFAKCLDFGVKIGCLGH